MVLYWSLPQQAGLFTLQPGAVIQVSYLLAGKCSFVVKGKKVVNLDRSQRRVEAVKISWEGRLLEKPECVIFLLEAT